MKLRIRAPGRDENTRRVLTTGPWRSVSSYTYIQKWGQLYHQLPDRLHPTVAFAMLSHPLCINRTKPAYNEMLKSLMLSLYRESVYHKYYLLYFNQYCTHTMYAFTIRSYHFWAVDLRIIDLFFLRFPSYPLSLLFFLQLFIYLFFRQSPRCILFVDGVTLFFQIGTVMFLWRLIVGKCTTEQKCVNRKQWIFKHFFFVVYCFHL